MATDWSELGVSLFSLIYITTLKVQAEVNMNNIGISSIVNSVTYYLKSYYGTVTSNVSLHIIKLSGV